MERHFYRRTSAGWVRVNVDDDWWAATEIHIGRQRDWRFAPLDAGYVRAYASLADEAFEAACAQIGCDPDLRLSVRLDGRYLSSPNGNLLLSGFREAALEVDTSLIGLRRVAVIDQGLPLDAPARDFERRWLGLMVLVAPRERLQRTMTGPETDGLAAMIGTALWVRLAERLGFDPTGAAEWVLPDPGALDLDNWLRPVDDTFMRYSTEEAQIALNRILLTSDPETELRLLRTVATARDPIGRLADGLQIAPEEARLIWRSAASPLSLTLASPSPGAFLVDCDGRLATASPGDREPRWLSVSARIAPSSFAVWSPDGRRLVTTSGVLHGFDAGTSTSVTAGVIGGGFEAQWLNARPFVATAWGTDPARHPPGRRAGHSGRQSPGWGAVAWSPDRQYFFAIRNELGVTTSPGAVLSRRHSDDAWMPVGLIVLDAWLAASQQRNVRDVAFGADSAHLYLLVDAQYPTERELHLASVALATAGVTIGDRLDPAAGIVRLLSGVGLLRWNPEMAVLTLYGPSSDASGRHIAVPEGFDLNGIGPRYVPALDLSWTQTADQLYVWRHPADLASRLERVDLPCRALAANPAPQPAPTAPVR
jgi:hypothetical protein